MKITESRLRSVIRSVILESLSAEEIEAGWENEKGWVDWSSKTKSKGIKLRKQKGIDLSKGRDKIVQNRLISKFRKDLNLEDDIIPEKVSSFSKSFGKEIKTKEKAITTYDIKLFQNEKDESKANSFIGPVIGKFDFLIRYEGNVFAVKIKYAYPEDRDKHESDMVKKLKDLKFSKITRSNISDF